MAMLIADPAIVRRIRRTFVHPDMTRRHECWNGIAYIPPIPDNEHAALQAYFGYPLSKCITEQNLGECRFGTNISDRRSGWKKNYRIPDLAVFLNGTASVNHQTHWQGGPDFLVEIISEGEDPHAKLDFYESVRTREVLIVERDPWTIELHRLIDGRLARMGRIRAGDAPLSSAVLPLTFALETMTTGRPKVKVTHASGEPVWMC